MSTDTNKPFEWTIGNVKSSIGDHFAMTFGEDCSSTLGISANVVVGTYATVVCDPTEFLKLLGPLGMLLNKFLGRQKFIMGPHYTYNFGEVMTLNLGTENIITPGEIAKKTLVAWSRVASLASLAAMVYFGGSAPKLQSADDQKKALDYTIFGSAFFLALVAASYALLYSVADTVTDVGMWAAKTAYNALLGPKPNGPFGDGDADNVEGG